MPTLRYALLFLACISTLWTADPPKEKKQPPPDPLELPKNWWGYFSEHTILEEHSQALLELLKAKAGEISPANAAQMRSLAEKIAAGLQTLNKEKAMPPPEPIPIPSIADTYLIQKIIDVNRNALRKAIEISANQTQQNDEMREIDITQNYIDTLWAKYQAAEMRSEAKLLLGLEIILYTISLEVAKQSLLHLKETYEVDNNHLSALHEELEIGITRLHSDPAEERFFQTQVAEAKAAWEKARSALQSREAESVVSISPIANQEKDAEIQLLMSKIQEASIQEAVAANSYLEAEISLLLSRLLNHPGESNTIETENSILQWTQQIADFDKKRKQWGKRAEDTFRQYSQIFSLNNPASAQSMETVRSIINTTQANFLLLQQFKNEIAESSFLLRILDLKLTDVVGGKKKWLADTAEFFVGIFASLKDWTGRTLVNVGDNRITPFDILQFCFILGLSFWLLQLFRKALVRLAKESKTVTKAVLYRINRLFTYLFLIIALIIALTSIGFDFSNLLLVAGALGVGLGFGLQSIFNNFISGIIILFESNLKVGDYIELEEGGLRGEIKEINVRSTIVATNDGTDVLIPNSEIISRRLINWTLREPFRRMTIPFSVAYGTDKELMQKVVLEAAESVPYTLYRKAVPEPHVYINKLGESSLECELIVWVDEKATRRNRNTRSAYLWAIETLFRKHGIIIPNQQLDIHISNKSQITP